LNSSDPVVVESFSPEIISALKALEKKRRLTENRMLLWLAVPVLWILPIIMTINIQSQALSIFTLVWIFLVLFGIGIYIHVVLPSNEEISNQYKKLIIPELIRIIGAEGEFSLGHGLKVDSFMKSGLYHEKYSHFERTDSIIGKFQNVKFGLYELAVQVGKTMGGQMSMGTGMMMPQSSLLTNMFYGWVLHVPVKSLSGNTYIIPLKRKAKGESDDWIKATSEFFSREKEKQVYRSNDAIFDSTFQVITSNPAEAEKIMSKTFRDYLLFVFNAASNAPGFSFVGNRAYMHIGISDSGFERQLRQSLYPPDTDKLLQKIRFFSSIALVLHSAADGKA
jgi:hypothetical protein